MEKTAVLQAAIDLNKKKCEMITKDMEGIKVVNAKRKEEGGSDMVQARQRIRDVKDKIFAAMKRRRRSRLQLMGLMPKRRQVERSSVP